ncbi:MAG: hypothetical protein ACKO81_13475 [Planctomycetota bacterium]
MVRLLPLVLCLAFLSSAICSAQITLEILGESQGGTFSFESADGAPLVLAPVPGWMPTSPDQLLKMPRVESDLQLLPEQKEELQAKLKQRREEFRVKRDEIAKEITPELSERDREKLNKEMADLELELRDEIKDAIDEVLLPFQKQRLDQIVAQTKLNNNGSGALMTEEFAKLLKLSDEQKKELEQKQQELQKKLQEEIRELRRKRQRELVETVLTKEQLAKLKQLIGDDLAPDEKQDKKQRD